MSSFNRRFASFNYNMPKYIQPLVGATKLHYVDAFDSDFALLLREKIGMSYYYVSRFFRSGI